MYDFGKTLVMKCVVFSLHIFLKFFLNQEFIEVLINIYIDLHVSFFVIKEIKLIDIREQKKKTCVLYKLVACVHMPHPNYDILPSVYLFQPAF